MAAIYLCINLSSLTGGGTSLYVSSQVFLAHAMAIICKNLSFYTDHETSYFNKKCTGNTTPHAHDR